MSARSRRKELAGAYKDLVEEVLDELLLERARGKQSVEVGSEELGNKVAVVGVRKRRGGVDEGAHMSSNGEIKTSLRLMICKEALREVEEGARRGIVRSRAECA